MKVSEAVGHALVAEGIELAAGLGGTHIFKIIDEIASHREINLMYARQERVALDICDGFARASGKPAVCFTDSGPAVANVMGGLVNSWSDSSPVLLIAGHVDRAEVMKGGTKEIPFLELFRPVSKWAELINDPSQVSEIMRRAFMQLRTGRPGPVVIGMPHDVSQLEIGDFHYTAVSSQPRVRSGADPASVAEAVQLLAKAKAPYVYAGAGILQSEASGELVALAELLTLPVATTLNGKSAFPERHPLSLGMGGYTRGFYGSLPAAKIADAADVILTIGCGFKQHAVWGRPKHSVKHIQIDIDPGEIHRDHIADLALLGDAKVVLGQMAAAAQEQVAKSRLKPVTARLEAVAKLKAEWTEVSAPLLNSNEEPVNPFRVTKEIMACTDPDKTIVLHDAGTVRGTTSQHYLASKPRSFLGFGGQSSMGWSVGAALGAKKARPDHLVVAVVGEEALNETAMDIETSIRNDAPVLYVVKNNRRRREDIDEKEARFIHARFHSGPDICALAKALGANARRIEKPGDVGPGLKAAIAEVKAGKTTVVEILTSRQRPSLYRLWDEKD